MVKQDAKPEDEAAEGAVLIHMLVRIQEPVLKQQSKRTCWQKVLTIWEHFFCQHFRV